MKERDIVKFKEPIYEDERTALLVVLEMREDRALVSNLRFKDWSVPPTNLYPLSQLVVVESVAE